MPVTGLGGILFTAKDPAALGAWYAKHLGVNDLNVNHEPWLQQSGPTVFAVFPEGTDMFGSQSVLLNFRVEGLKDFVEQLKADGVRVVKDTYEEAGVGRFASVEDPEGNRVELWEPEEEPPAPTRAILHGGNTAKHSAKNAKFYQEIVSGAEGDTVRVLCVYFARPEHRWKASYEEDQAKFEKVETKKAVETTLASYDQFADQVAAADVVFMNGGIMGHLRPVVLTIGLERFRRLLAGKTLVGISAGANALAKYYYSTVAKEIREGTGLLNLKLLTHYSEDDADTLAKLKAHGEDLPVVTIAEEEYVVINEGGRT